MSNLILLVGLPGSGKSTLAQGLAKRGRGWAIISTDAIRAQLFGDEAIQGSWLLIQQALARSLQGSAQQALQGQIEGAIYDATHVVRKHRREAVALARRMGFTHITVIWLDVPLTVCLERNAQRARQVPEAVVTRMHRRLYGAPPDLTESVQCLVRYRKFW